MTCPTSHIEADGQLVDLFPINTDPNHFQIAVNELPDGHHAVFDPMVLTCPTCHVIVGRPYDPQNLPRTTAPRKSEIGLNRRHQRRT